MKLKPRRLNNSTFTPREISRCRTRTARHHLSEEFSGCLLQFIACRNDFKGKWRYLINFLWAGELRQAVWASCKVEHRFLLIRQTLRAHWKRISNKVRSLHHSNVHFDSKMVCFCCFSLFFLYMPKLCVSTNCLYSIFNLLHVISTFIWCAGHVRRRRRRRMGVGLTARWDSW